MLRQALQQDVVLTKTGARIAVKPVTVLDSAPEITKSVNAAVFEQIRLSPSPAHGRVDEALQRQMAAGKTTAVRCGRGGRLVQALGRSGSATEPESAALEPVWSGNTRRRVRAGPGPAGPCPGARPAAAPRAPRGKKFRHVCHTPSDPDTSIGVEDPPKEAKVTTVTGPRSAQSVDVPAPIRRVREVAVFRNRFGTLFNDDVVAPSGAAGQYLRWQWNQDGVVVVPVSSAGYALVPAYRYPVHAASIEFPRGGVEGDEELAAAAARELREETGLICEAPRRLGLIHADTGIIASSIPEAMESVSEPVWIAPAELPRWLADGRITCGVTLAALALVQSLYPTLSAGHPEAIAV